MSDYVIVNGELYHYGIKGMKWGVRRTKEQLGYKSTGVRAALARRSNEKVDKGFKNWGENAKKRDDAISLGKQANAAKLAYERDRSNKELKTAYKTANKQYKKVLSGNTAYRKGVVRQEVGRDASRKYLSEAKKVKKQLAADPSNKALQKRYDDLMSKHDIERANARRAAEVGKKRSRKIAAVKRSMTMTAKAAAGSAAVAAGVYAANRYLSSHDVTLNGKRVTIGAQNIADIAGVARQVKNLMDYLY